MTAFAAKQPPLNRPRANTPETAESIKSVTPEPVDIETRKIVNMMCSVKPQDDGCDLSVKNNIGALNGYSNSRKFLPDDNTVANGR